MNYEPSGLTLPTNSKLFLAACAYNSVGLSPFGLRCEGVETHPGLNGKVPDIKTPIKKCTIRLARQ